MSSTSSSRMSPHPLLSSSSPLFSMDDHDSSEAPDMSDGEQLNLDMDWSRESANGPFKMQPRVSRQPTPSSSLLTPHYMQQGTIGHSPLYMAPQNNPQASKTTNRLQQQVQGLSVQVTKHKRDYAILSGRYDELSQRLQEFFTAIPSALSFGGTHPFYLDQFFGATRQQLEDPEWRKTVFWTVNDWQEHLASGGHASDGDGQDGGKQKNITGRWFRHANGAMVCGDRVAGMRARFTSTLQDNKDLCPPTWGPAGTVLIDRCTQAVASMYPEAAYCEGNWKLEDLFHKNYSAWYLRYILGGIRPKIEGTDEVKIVEVEETAQEAVALKPAAAVSSAKAKRTASSSEKAPQPAEKRRKTVTTTVSGTRSASTAAASSSAALPPITSIATPLSSSTPSTVDISLTSILNPQPLPSTSCAVASAAPAPTTCQATSSALTTISRPPSATLPHVPTNSPLSTSQTVPSAVPPSIPSPAAADVAPAESLALERPSAPLAVAAPAGRPLVEEEVCPPEVRVGLAEPSENRTLPEGPSSPEAPNVIQSRVNPLMSKFMAREEDHTAALGDPRLKLAEASTTTSSSVGAPRKPRQPSAYGLWKKDYEKRNPGVKIVAKDARALYDSLPKEETEVWEQRKKESSASA